MKSRAIYLVVALAMGLPVMNAVAEEIRPLDTAVKAAYLLNFGRFATWRAAAAPDPAPFNLCVFGPDPFGPTLDRIVKDEKIDGRPVIVKRVESVNDVGKCRILFVGGVDQARLRQVLPAAEHLGILTVSDLPRFIDLGGTIQFVVEGSKVRFRVNLPAAERAGVVLSSELLRVAASVATSSSQ